MNLTYDFGGLGDCECASCGHNAAASMLSTYRGKASKNTGRFHDVANSELSGFFSKIANTVKDSLIRTNKYPLVLTKALVQGGPKAALQAVKDEGHGAARDLSVFGPVVTPIATAINPVIGAAVGAASAAANVDVARQKAKALKSSPVSDLLPQYQALLGQVPGRVYGVPLLRDVFIAAVDGGIFSGFDPKWNHTLMVDNALNSCAKGCGAGLKPFVTDAVSQGVTDPFQILQPWLDAIKASWGGTPWGLPNNPTAKQLWIDLIDAYVVERNSNAPVYYGGDPQSAPAQQAAPVQQAAPAQMIQTQAVAREVLTPPRVATTRAPVSTLQQAGVDPRVQANMDAMLKNMADQGASQAQMMSSMMSQLQAQGVNTSAPAVQQAAAQTVATAGQSSINPWVIGALGAAALVFALARPAKRAH